MTRYGLVLALLRLNVPVNNFSVMSGRSHRFLGISSTFRGVNESLLKDTTRWRYVLDPRSLALESEALPLGHRAPRLVMDTGVVVVVKLFF